MAVATADTEEQNFWPGYVDTLVNMTMFLILLIVILSIAVMYFSVRARNEAYQAKATQREVSKQAFNKVYPGESDQIPENPTMEDMRKLVDRLKQKLYQSELRNVPTGLNPVAKAENTKVGKSERVEDATAKAGTLPQGVQDFALRPSSLIIRFRPGSLDLSAEEVKRLKEVFVKHFDFQSGSPQAFQLTVDAAEGLSESNRMAFYRLVAVRNHLMSEVGVSASKITQKILPVPLGSVTGVEALEVRINKID